MTTVKAMPWSIADACVQRVDHGAGKPRSLAECVEQVEHPLAGMSSAELVEVVAFLSAQVVGYQHNQNADAVLDTCVGHHPSEPPTAETGRLCLVCFSRLRSGLLGLPAVAGWLHVHVAAGGAANERVSGSRDDPIPLRVDILDLIGPDSRRPPPAAPAATVLLWEDGVPIGYYDSWAEAVHARWAEILDAPELDVDVHRWQVRVTERGGVDQRGEESLRAAVMYWARRIHDEAGFPWTDRNDLTGLVAWIVGHLDWIAGQEWVAELAEEVHRLTTTAHKIAPWRPETMRDDDPCDRCGVRAVVLRVAESTLRCEKRLGGCGKVTVSDYLLKSTG